MDDDEQLMKDSDQDGMPDGYEQSVGLNPNDATDGYRLTESGYSNLELFLNGVADGTIDLTPYKTAPAVEKRQLFNAVVDPTDVAAFKTIGEAVADAEKHATAAAPYYILVKAGTYNEHVEISKPFIHLTGVNREQVVITFDYIMKPIAVTHSQQRHEFLSAPDVIHNHSDHMARTPENNVNGPFGLSWDGKEVLPPQFKEVNLIVDDKAIVCLNGKYGLLQMHPNDRFRFSLNKGDALGFRHKRFETTIRLDVPSYVHSNATTIDMDGVAGILVDKISRETKNTEYGNYVQYDCVLDIPEGITDELSPISFTANINYDGLRAVPTPFTANAWHSQYYNVEINEKETTISNGTLAFTSDIDPKRLAGEAVYPYTVTLNTNLHFELVEKVSETRYKWKVTGLKEGMNTINVQIQEDGCPPAEVSFDVEYVKRSAKSGPDKVVVTKKKPKPQPVQQHLDV